MPHVARHASPETSLPRWGSTLAVVAHPDDESFGLGAVLDAFVQGGSTVGVLCLTHGEASTVHGIAGDLALLRAAELQEAAHALGVTSTRLLNHHDGALRGTAERAVNDILAAVYEVEPDGILVFDSSGVTSHPDHVAATAAAVAVAESRNLPVLAWTLPAAVAAALADELGAGFVGHEDVDIDIVLPVDRTRQRIASLAHASQAIPTSVLWRRLDLLGDVEHLRWLRRVPLGSAQDR